MTNNLNVKSKQIGMGESRIEIEQANGALAAPQQRSSASGSPVLEPRPNGAQGAVGDGGNGGGDGSGADGNGGGDGGSGDGFTSGRDFDLDGFDYADGTTTTDVYADAIQEWEARCKSPASFQSRLGGRLA